MEVGIGLDVKVTDLSCALRASMCNGTEALFTSELVSSTLRVSGVVTAFKGRRGLLFSSRISHHTKYMSQTEVAIKNITPPADTCSPMPDPLLVVNGTQPVTVGW